MQAGYDKDSKAKTQTRIGKFSRKRHADVCHKPNLIRLSERDEAVEEGLVAILNRSNQTRL